MGNPRHIAVIMDGNRRYAEMCGLSVIKGHELGMKRLRCFLRWCKEYEIKEVTLYALSTKNLKRNKIEINFLFSLFASEGKEILEKSSEDMKIRFIGNRNLVPKHIRDLMDELEEKTKDNKKYKLNIAIAYDGRDEIVRAVNKVGKDLECFEITEDEITKELDLPSEPDLIIRTSENRLSGFLLWQSSYSEIIFLPEILWPMLQKKDFRACLEEFRRRKRTHGL